MGEWRYRPLAQLVENLDTKRIPVKESDRRPGPYPYYGASGIVDHIDAYIFNGLHLLIAEDGENLRTRKLPIAFLADGRFWVCAVTRRRFPAGASPARRYRSSRKQPEQAWRRRNV